MSNRLLSEVGEPYLIAKYGLSNNDVKNNQRRRGERQMRRSRGSRRGDREKRRRAGDPEPDPAILPVIYYYVECYRNALGL